MAPLEDSLKNDFTRNGNVDKKEIITIVQPLWDLQEHVCCYGNKRPSISTGTGWSERSVAVDEDVEHRCSY